MNVRLFMMRISVVKTSLLIKITVCDMNVLSSNIVSISYVVK